MKNVQNQKPLINTFVAMMKESLVKEFFCNYSVVGNIYIVVCAL